MGINTWTRPNYSRPDQSQIRFILDELLDLADYFELKRSWRYRKKVGELIRVFMPPFGPDEAAAFNNTLKALKGVGWKPDAKHWKKCPKGAHAKRR
jgi:hypothetical protein